jgi:hypothetical protein
MESPIKVNRALEEQISKATTQEEISALCLEAAAKQNLLTRVGNDYAMVETPQVFGAVVTVNGQKFNVQGATQEEADAKAAEVVRNAVAQPAQTHYSTMSAEDKQNLDLAFKRGDISADEYIEKSKLIETFMASRGVNVNDIREAIHGSAADTRVHDEWAAATERFLASPAGADWPSGEKNKSLLLTRMVALNLIDSPDKCDAIRIAYEDLKRTGVLFDGPEDNAPLSSNASPAEILQAWRDAVKLSGGNENDEFERTFTKK